MRPAIKFIKNHFPNTPLVGAEIGVCEGDHAKEILQALDMQMLYLIDIWEIYIQEGIPQDYTNHREKVVNELGVLDNVEVIKHTSWNARPAKGYFEDDTLDFVYIDACHQEESVALDCWLWYPTIKLGGVLAGHDYNEVFGVIPGVARFIKRWKIEYLHVQGDDWWVVKK